MSEWNSQKDAPAHHTGNTVLLLWLSCNAANIFTGICRTGMMRVERQSAIVGFKVHVQLWGKNAPKKKVYVHESSVHQTYINDCINKTINKATLI